MSLREQNKQEKLARITSVAQKLFTEKGVGEVTTLEVSKAADVATGTLFLYARNKGELLLLAQNASYLSAHEAGLIAAENEVDVISATMALISPIVACNRENVENGRTYLREVVFGEGLNEHRLTALAMMTETELEIVRILKKSHGTDLESANSFARSVMANLFLLLSSPEYEGLSADQVVEVLRTQISFLSKSFM